MTTNEILTLLRKEIDHLNRRKQTALARGQWQKAADCDTALTAIENCIKSIVYLEANPVINV